MTILRLKFIYIFILKLEFSIILNKMKVNIKIRYNREKKLKGRKYERGKTSRDKL